ncbi:MAG: aldo/keto reductase [Bryobacterales bacterium]
MISESNRREFLTLAGSAALAAGLARKADAAGSPAGEWRNKRPDLSYRRLGRTNMMISEIICGGNTISPTNYQHVVAAFDMGLNFFDTAAAYGNDKSDRLRKALKEVGRQNVFLTSKASPWVGERNAALKKIFESLPEAEQKEAHDDPRRLPSANSTKTTSATTSADNSPPSKPPSSPTSSKRVARKSIARACTNKPSSTPSTPASNASKPTTWTSSCVRTRPTAA